jgi:hypothetical protein
VAVPASTEQRRRTGRCLCGDVRFEALGAPKWVAWCHCESCRRATGVPVTAYAGFPAEAVRFTGVPPALFASSPGVQRGFCPRCGTSLSFVGERWPGEIHLHLGCFDDASDLVPTVEAYAEERVPWVRLVLP